VRTESQNSGLRQHEKTRDKMECQPTSIEQAPRGEEVVSGRNAGEGGGETQRQKARRQIRCSHLEENRQASNTSKPV